MAQFSSLIVGNPTTGICLPAVPDSLKAKAVKDLATNKAATKKMVAADNDRAEAEGDYCSTLETLYHLLPYAKDLENVSQWDFVARFMGRTKGDTDTGSSMTEPCASQWVAAAKAVVVAKAPTVIVKGGRSALVRWWRSHDQATKDLVKANTTGGLPKAIAKAKAEADMVERGTVARAEATKMAKAKNAPSAEVIAAQAIGVAVPESASAAKAIKDAKARATTRTSKAKAEAIAAAKAPAGRMDSIEAIAAGFSRIREIDMAEAHGTGQWATVATAIVVTMGEGEAEAIAKAIAKAIASAK